MPVELWIVLSFFVIFVLALLVLRWENLLNDIQSLVLAAVFLLLALFLRSLCMGHETLDYQDFLSVWVQYFRDHGGFAALADSIGNYNVPYLYFLALFSYFKADDLYLIKLLSIVFDFLLAWGAMRLVGTVTKSAGKRLFTFLAILLLPTVILNGSLWGQCDSIYVSLAVWSIYFALSDHPVRAVVFITLSFSFKLQAVFLMPIFAVFLMMKKIRWPHLLIFPLTYLIVVAPAVLLGRPLLDTLTLYFNQAGSVGSGLNYNSPSIFAFLTHEMDTETTEIFASLGIGAAFAAMCLVLYWFWRRRHRLRNETVLTCCLFLAICIPFLLPHMHDRYFFAADILSLVFAAAVPRLSVVPVCVSFASLLGYHAYLKMRYLLPMSYGSIALLLAMVLILWHLTRLLRPRRRAKP